MEEGMQLIPPADGKDPSDEKAEYLNKVDILGQRLYSLAVEQIGQRAEIEDRWLQDLRQYNGRYEPKVESALNIDPTKSKVFVNVTRAKTNVAEARMGDMLFPTDDRNWGLGPTPNPELAKKANSNVPVGQDPNTGQPITEGQEIQNVLKEARDRARAMEREINDQLVESKYNVISRQVIHDACKLGTGIIKGPVIVSKSRRRWMQESDNQGNSVQILSIEDDLTPQVARVDPWNFFPEMAATEFTDADFCFERMFLTKKRLKELGRRPGFDVSRVLEMEPKATRIDRNYVEQIRAIGGIQAGVDDNRYEIWCYHGPVEKEDLIECGCDEEDLEGLDGEISGVIWFCHNIVIKASINVMETGDLPYSVFNWEQADGSIFGYGVPWQMRNPQRVMNAAWRIMLENGGLSSGPQVVTNQEVEPIDGNWVITPRKVWRAVSPNTDIRGAFAIFDIPSNQRDTMNIFMSAKQLADEETGLPVIAQGDQGRGPGPTQTFGGMSILMNSFNVVMRRAVKNFDDFFTVPTITRFYDWNMQYSDKEDIKGDFKVDARGSSALLAKEQQAQNLMQLTQLMGTPGFAEIIKPESLARKVAQSMQLSDEDILKSQEEIDKDRAAAEEAGPPPDPAVMKAEMNAQQQKYKMDVTYQMHQERRQDAQAEREFRMAGLRIEREIAILKLMTEREISAEKVRAELAKASMQISSDQDKFAAELDVKAITGPEGNYGLE